MVHEHYGLLEWNFWWAISGWNENECSPEARVATIRRWLVTERDRVRLMGDEILGLFHEVFVFKQFAFQRLFSFTWGCIISMVSCKTLLSCIWHRVYTLRHEGWRICCSIVLIMSYRAVLQMASAQDQDISKSTWDWPWGLCSSLLSCLNGSINWLACFFYKIKLPCFCWLRRWSLPTGQRLLVHISTLGVWAEGEHKCNNEVPWETINIGLMSMRAYQH